MNDFKHILVVIVAFIVVITGFLFVRRWLIPEGYGRIGRYRAPAVDEVKALPIHHAGQEQCEMCHEDRVKEKAESSHKTIRCESCHGALADHVEDPTGVKPWKPKENEVVDFCIRCHSINLSKPKAFPQVNPQVHYPESVCTTCHNPHKPK